MATLIVRGVPDSLQNWLKNTAQKHHRSMAGEVLTILEERFSDDGPGLDLKKAPKPFKFRKKVDMSPEAVQASIDQGQE